MYREANAWQSSFFAPQDTKGLIGLYPSPVDFEKQLDRLFSIPWNENYIAMNINCFIGHYCHGNQPDHGFPYLYYFVGKQEKSQAVLNTIMDRFYGMGGEGLALCGMDDAGEMSANGTSSTPLASTPTPQPMKIILYPCHSLTRPT